jgi:hypothetical protein
MQGTRRGRLLEFLDIGLDVDIGAEPIRTAMIVDGHHAARIAWQFVEPYAGARRTFRRL